MVNTKTYLEWTSPIETTTAASDSHGNDVVARFEETQQRGAQQQTENVSSVAQKFDPGIDEEFADRHPQSRVVKYLFFQNPQQDFTIMTG